MLRRPIRQQGFTLIEVSLAIVIGVVILAGGISLYNQTKLSAGNSKAQERVLALASLVEEMGASSIAQSYPTITNLNTIWAQRRPDDAKANPWGGIVTGTNAILAPAGASNGGTGGGLAPWSRATNGSAGTAGTNVVSSDDSYTPPSTFTTPNAQNDQGNIGQLIYNYGPGQVCVYDPAQLGVLRKKKNKNVLQN